MAARLNSRFGQVTAARSDEGPTVRREGCEQFNGASYRNYPFSVVNLALFEVAIECLVVSIRQKFADGLEAGAPVGLASSLYRLKSVLHCPLLPDAGDDRGRVDQHTVEVKKKSACGHDHTVMIPYRGTQPAEEKKLVDIHGRLH